MGSNAAVVHSIELIILAGCALTSIKLLYSGLYKRYRALLAYVSFRLIYTSALVFVFRNTQSAAYGWFWIYTEPIIWLFHTLVVIELYSLILERHKGLYTLGRWVLYVGLSVAILISGLALLPELTGGQAQQSRLLPYYLAIERGVDFSLLIFLLLILLWLTRYPVPLSRNVMVHSVVYSVLFLSNTVGMLGRVIFGYSLSDSVSTFVLGVGAVCIYIWFFFLTRKGEEVRINLPIFGPEHEERILNQLDALNKTLLKVSRD